MRDSSAQAARNPFETSMLGLRMSVLRCAGGPPTNPLLYKLLSPLKQKTSVYGSARGGKTVTSRGHAMDVRLAACRLVVPTG
jgi:hypothetical protein